MEEEEGEEHDLEDKRKEKAGRGQILEWTIGGELGGK